MIKLDQATPRRFYCIDGQFGMLTDKGETLWLGSFEDHDAFFAAIDAIATYDEREALLREAQKFYECLDAVISPREFERFEKDEIEFSGEAINELRATLARIRTALGESGEKE